MSESSPETIAKELILDRDALINKNIFLKTFTVSEDSYNDFINTIEEQFFKKENITITFVTAATSNTLGDDNVDIINKGNAAFNAQTAAPAKTIHDKTIAELKSLLSVLAAGVLIKETPVPDNKKDMTMKYLAKIKINSAYDNLVQIYNIIQKIEKKEGKYVLDITATQSKELAITAADFAKIKKDYKKTQEQYRKFIQDFEDYTKVDKVNEADVIVIDKEKFTKDIFYARIIGGYNDFSSQAAMELDKYKQRYLKGFLKTKQSLEELIQRANPLRVRYYRTYNKTEYTRETIKAIKRALREFEEKTKRETDDKKLLLLNIVRAFQLSPDDKYTINRLNSITGDAMEFKIKGGGGEKTIVYLDILTEWLKGFMTEDDYKKLTNYISNPSEATLESLRNISPQYQEKKLQDFQAMALSIQETMTLLVENINKTFTTMKETVPKKESIEDNIVNVMKLLVDKLNDALTIAKTPKELSIELSIKESIDALIKQLTILVSKIEPIAEKYKEAEVPSISQDITNTMGQLTKTLTDIIGVITAVSEKPDINDDIQTSLKQMIEYFQKAIESIKINDLKETVAQVQLGLDLLTSTEIPEVLSKFANQLDTLLQSTLVGSIEFLVHLDITQTLVKLYEYIKQLKEKGALTDADLVPLTAIIEAVNKATQEKKPLTSEQITTLLSSQTEAIASISTILHTIQETLARAEAEAEAARAAAAEEEAPGAEAEAPGAEAARAAAEEEAPGAEAEAAGAAAEAAARTATPGEVEAASVEAVEVEVAPREEPAAAALPEAAVVPPGFSTYVNPLPLLDMSRPSTASPPLRSASDILKKNPTRVAWPSLSEPSLAQPPESATSIGTLPETETSRWAESVAIRDIGILDKIIEAPKSEINDFHEILKKIAGASILGKYIIGAFIIANLVESSQTKDKNMYTLTTGISVFIDKLTSLKNPPNIDEAIKNFKIINKAYLDTSYTILNSKILLGSIDSYNTSFINAIFRPLFNTEYVITTFTWRQLLENILNDIPLQPIEDRSRRRLSISGGNKIQDTDSMDGGAPQTNTAAQQLTPEKIKEMKEKISAFTKSVASVKENINNIKSKFNAYEKAAPQKGFEEINLSEEELKILNTFFSTKYPKIAAYNNIITGPGTEEDYKTIGYPKLYINETNKADVIKHIQETYAGARAAAVRAATANIRANDIKLAQYALFAAAAPPASPATRPTAAEEDIVDTLKQKIKNFIKISINVDIDTFIQSSKSISSLFIPALNKIPGEQGDYIADKYTLTDYPNRIINKFNIFNERGNRYSNDEYIALTEYFKKNGDSLKKDITAEGEKIKANLQQNYTDLMMLLKPFETKQWYKDLQKNLLELIENDSVDSKGIKIVINETIRSIIEDIDTLSSRVQQKAQIAEKTSKEQLELAKLEQKKREYEAQKAAETERAKAEREKAEAERQRAEAERQIAKAEAERQRAAAAAATTGGQKGGAQNREKINESLDNLNIKIDEVVKVFKGLEQKITNISDPATSLALSGDRSIFNALYNKYLESKQRGDVGGDMRATEELIESLEANQLVPRAVLAVNMRDKIIFIFATLFIRLFSLSVIEFMIEKGAIKNSNFAILGYLGLFSLVFIAFTLLVNLDMYRLRIVFNYINFHANAANVYTYLALFWVFGGVIYYVTYYLNKDAPLLNTTDETKVRLIYRIQVISLIIWLFLVLMVSIL